MQIYRHNIRRDDDILSDQSRFLTGDEVAQLGVFCDSMIKVANIICVEGAAEKNLELLEQNTLALRVVAQLGGDSGVAAGEISSAVSGAGAKTDELVKSVVG
jgi:hypothetical protein